MNRIIQAGDTLSAVVKLAIAGGVVYGAFRLYSTAKDIQQFSEDKKRQLDNAVESVSEFATETINPASSKNFIFSSSVGQQGKKGFFKLFDALGIGK